MNWKEHGRKRSCWNLRYSQGIILKELRKTAKQPRYNTWSLGRDFNPQATKHAIHSSTTFNNVNTTQNMFKIQDIFQNIHMHTAYKTEHNFGQIMMALWSVRF
jgi:hypothetical protein